MNDIASAIIKPALEEIFLTGWDHFRVILFFRTLRLRKNNNCGGSACRAYRLHVQRG